MCPGSQNLLSKSQADVFYDHIPVADGSGFGLHCFLSGNEMLASCLHEALRSARLSWYLLDTAPALIVNFE